MRPRRWRALILTLASAASACSASAPSPSPGDSGAPATNRGFAEGTTFPELSLVGYLDKNHDGALTAEEHGSLRPSEILAANPQTELLLVHVAFGWCKYCWEETAEQIKMTKGYGGRFLSIQVLVEDRNGDPTTKAFADEWIRLNKSAMPTTLEAEGTLRKTFGRAATYLLIDPKDGMKVLVVGAGPPTFGYVRDKIANRLGPHS